MAQYDNTNKGSLFRNKDKEDPKQPDYTGAVNVNGEEFWFSGWIKTAGPRSKIPGEKFLSVALQPKRDTSPSGSFNDDDDIPF